MTLNEIAEQLENIAKALRKIDTNKRAAKAIKRLSKEVKKTETKTEVKKEEKRLPAVPDYSIAKDFFGGEELDSDLQQFLDDPPFDPDPPKPQPPPKRSGRRSPQEIFEEKLEAGKIDEFTSSDLVCFFRYCAERKGIRYAVNWPKDSSHMKKLREEFDVREIILMIEFLFFSPQDYLDKRRLSVGILTTGWLNTIYQDALDWQNDEYVPRTKKRQKNAERSREWEGDKDDKVKVGGLE